MERPSWIKDKKLAKDFEVIEARVLDNYKDWIQDNGCYLLIKVYRDTQMIGVAVCDYDHNILKEFRGIRGRDIWNSIFDYEKENNLNWLTSKDHIAYLGKELKKAEIALSTGFEYFQE
mgnify:CR=1 FL=1|tara:strand:+ start:5066 stop:5419 length:354 start_codon:yes stop_codon:yes gene_type:complete